MVLHTNINYLPLLFYVKNTVKLIVAFSDFSLVPISWGKETYDELTRLGVSADFKTLRNTLHELKAAELLEIQEWISKLVPPLESDIQNKL